MSNNGLRFLHTVQPHRGYATKQIGTINRNRCNVPDLLLTVFEKPRFDGMATALTA